jgi:hypothetical protein
VTQSAQADHGTLRRVLVKRVRDAFLDQATVDGQWRDLGYTAAPDHARAAAESADAGFLLRHTVRLRPSGMPHR